MKGEDKESLHEIDLNKPINKSNLVLHKLTDMDISQYHPALP